MNKIAQFDKQSLSLLRREIDEALAAIGKKYEISLKAGNARYQDTNATFKLELAIMDGDRVVSKEMGSLLMFLSVLGMDEGHLTKQFKLSNKTFVLAGYQSRKRKPMMIREVATGRLYNASEESVKFALGISATATA